MTGADVTRIAIAGAGRMGSCLADLVKASEDLELAGIWSRQRGAADALISNDPGELIQHADVLVDFSLPAGTATLVQTLKERPIPFVCGVSGLSDALLADLHALAVTIPVIYDRNMSMGVAVLSRLLGDAARALGDDFSIRIDETHHVHKKDAPSGTALKLGEKIAAVRGRTLDELWSKDTGEAIGHEGIDFQVERRGDVPGDHRVHFSSATESLTLAHSVSSRRVFAEGALAAARWVRSRPAGLYDMQDVLYGDSA